MRIAESPGLRELIVIISHRKHKSEANGKDIQGEARGEAAFSTHYDLVPNTEESFWTVCSRFLCCRTI